MTKETVVDYEVETREVERERVISDASGDELDPDEVVGFYVNPRVWSAGKGEKPPIYVSDDETIGADGVIHMAPEEAAEFHGIDLDDLETGDELPRYLVERDEVEVVERPWVQIGGETLATTLFIAASTLVSWSWWVWAILTQNIPESQMLAVSGVIYAVFAVLLYVGMFFSVAISFVGPVVLLIKVMYDD